MRMPADHCGSCREACVREELVNTNDYNKMPASIEGETPVESSKIEFEVDDPGLDVTPSPYIGLTPASLSRALKYMRDNDDLVIEAPSIEATIDYPLRAPITRQLNCEGGFTREQLCSRIAEVYQDIFREEQQTSSIPEGTVGNIIMNRAKTDGTYGIWGHFLDDLMLHTVYYDSMRESIRLGIDS